MAFSPPERDWKYMRKIENDLLASLCKRINNESMDILREGKGSEHDKYLNAGASCRACVKLQNFKGAKL